MKKQELIKELENYSYNNYDKLDNNDTLNMTLYKDLKNYIFELVRCEGEKGIFCYEYFFSINHLDNIMKWAKTITDIDYKDFKRLDEDINKLHLPGMPLLYELIGEYVSEMLYLLFKI